MPKTNKQKAEEIAEILSKDPVFSEKDASFVNGLIGRFRFQPDYGLSEKQLKYLDDLYEKACASEF